MLHRQGNVIGVFDSGVGGISVLAGLMRELPHERFLYFGDSANAPYGEKSQEWVKLRSREITDWLIENGAKAIVIACNTATSAAAAELRLSYEDVPIIGVEPALKPAALSEGVSRILVMATPMTLRLDKYQTLASTWGFGHEVIDAPCPGLAARIEQGDLDRADVEKLVDSLIGEYRNEIDAVVLGCTHYAFVAKAIKSAIGDVPLFDGALGTARQLHRKLIDGDILSLPDASGGVEFATSSESQGEVALYEEFLERAREMAF